MSICRFNYVFIYLSRNSTVSSYASTVVRTTKPFNPLLGETFEADRMHDRGWRCIAEQVFRILWLIVSIQLTIRAHERIGRIDFKSLTSSVLLYPPGQPSSARRSATLRVGWVGKFTIARAIPVIWAVAITCYFLDAPPHLYKRVRPSVRP